MGKAVQNTFSFTKPLDRQPVIFLVQEEAGLLAVLDIYHIPDAVFHDLHLCIKGVSDEALEPFHALLEADPGVAPFIDAADGDSVLGQHLFQLFQDHWLPPVDAQGQGFHHQHVGELVNDDPGKEVSFPEDQPAASCVHSGFSVFPGVPYPHFNKVLVHHCVGLSGHHADGDGGAGIDKAASQGITVKIEDIDHVPVLKFPFGTVDLVVIDPEPSGF